MQSESYYFERQSEINSPISEIDKSEIAKSKIASGVAASATGKEEYNDDRYQAGPNGQELNDDDIM